MLQISVTADIKEASRYLRRVGERNIPLAVAQALTGTAKHLAKVQARSTALHFDRPTEFTQRAFGVRMAKAADYKRGTMFSRVFAKDIQAGYLKFGVEGGRRTPKARALFAACHGLNFRLPTSARFRSEIRHCLRDLF